MALFYLDASALVKLVRAEPESAALRAFLGDAGIVSSELVLAEVPRALRRAAGDDPTAPLGMMLARAAEVPDALALQPLDRALLEAAGALDVSTIRTLDAVHVVAAVSLLPLDAFLTYDARQAAVARLAGLRTVAPGG